MNAEVIKAMNKKETKFDKARKWWRKNGYKVMRVVLFPIWGCVCAKEKIEAYLNSKLEWQGRSCGRTLQMWGRHRAHRRYLRGGARLQVYQA